VQPSGETGFIWDGHAVLADIDGAGTVTTIYTRHPTGFQSLVSKRQRNESRFYLHDALGSTKRLVDEQANVTDGYVYSAFGDPMAHAGMSANPYQFGGEYGYRNDDLDMLYVLDRYYDPAVGRWASRDRLQTVDSTNGYLYVGNQPTIAVDPFGLLAVNVCSGVRRDFSYKMTVPGWINTLISLLAKVRLPDELKLSGGVEGKVCADLCQCWPLVVKKKESITGFGKGELKWKGKTKYAWKDLPGIAVEYGFTVEGGAYLQKSRGGCKNENKVKLCGFIRGGAYVEGCAKAPGAKACLKGDAYVRGDGCFLPSFSFKVCGGAQLRINWCLGPTWGWQYCGDVILLSISGCQQLAGQGGGDGDAGGGGD
jgi:RHS repeat-associated protein